MREGFRGYLTTLATASLMILLTLFALAGCGGGTATYSLQVRVSGLDGGDSLRFVYDGTTETVSANGTITLALLPEGSIYSVVMTQQPFQKVCRLDDDEFSLNGIMPAASQTLSLECVPHSNLNDTGVNFDGTVDSLYGRDYFQRAGQLQKRGGGDAGFDFTKLSADGTELSADAVSWECVRDNHTGLVWENNDRPDRYSWADALAVDVTYSHCGLAGWRLPTRQELLSLWHFGAVDGRAAVDREYLPYIAPYPYWTETPAFEDETGVHVWTVLFDSESGGSNANPVIDYVHADSLEFVVLVNGSQVTDEASVNGASGILVDPRAGLVWQPCDIGQSWSGGECTGTASNLTWSESLDAADAADGWRLPDIKELLSLFDIDSDTVTFEPGASYWSICYFRLQCSHPAGSHC